MQKAFEITGKLFVLAYVTLHFTATFSPDCDKVAFHWIYAFLLPILGLISIFIGSMFVLDIDYKSKHHITGTHILIVWIYFMYCFAQCKGVVCYDEQAGQWIGAGRRNRKLQPDEAVKAMWLTIRAFSAPSMLYVLSWFIKAYKKWKSRSE
jgi:cell division protein FtsW (lipid II flippase)